MLQSAPNAKMPEPSESQSAEHGCRLPPTAVNSCVMEVISQVLYQETQSVSKTYASSVTAYIVTFHQTAQAKKFRTIKTRAGLGATVQFILLHIPDLITMHW